MIKQYINGQWVIVAGKKAEDGAVKVIVSADSESGVIVGRDVPALTAEQLQTIYNEIVAGNSVVIESENEEYFAVKEANSVDDKPTIYFDFEETHILKYALGESVVITAKEIGSGSGTGAVDSVNGKVGVVVLTAEDIKLSAGDVRSIKQSLDTAFEALDDKENTSNKTTTLSSSSTDTQYPSAKAVYDSVEEVREIAQDKVNAFVIDELDDITGTQDSDGNFTSVSAIEGIDDLSVLKVGYNIYIKDTSVPDYWVSSVDPVIKLNKLSEKIDITNLVDLSSAQTITGQKTFSNGVELKNDSSDSKWKIYEDASGRLFFSKNGTNFWLLDGGVLRPYNTNQNNIGTTTSHIKEAFINKLFGANQNAPTDDIINGTFNVINASDITSNTLTQAQVNIIKNGKETQIKGQLSGFGNIGAKLFPPEEYDTITHSLRGYCIIYSSNPKLGLYNINGNTRALTFSSAKYIFLENIATINGTNIGDFALKANTQNKATTVADTTHTTFSGSIESNKEYTFSQPFTSLSIVSCEVQTGDLAPIWSIVFTAGTGISVNLPDSVKWANGTTPTFTQGKIYKIMISQFGSNYLAVVGEF